VLHSWMMTPWLRTCCCCVLEWWSVYIHSSSSCWRSTEWWTSVWTMESNAECPVSLSCCNSILRRLLVGFCSVGLLFKSYSTSIQVPLKKTFLSSFYRPGFLPVAQPAVSKHWKELRALTPTRQNHSLNFLDPVSDSWRQEFCTIHASYLMSVV